MKWNQPDRETATRTARSPGRGDIDHVPEAPSFEPAVRGALHHPWCWFTSRCEIARTRRQLAHRLSPLERALDRSRHGRLRSFGHTLQVVTGSGSSDAAVLWLRSQVLPAVLREPGQWLFLVQECSVCPESHEADQYSVVEHVAARLRIPVVRDLFLPLSDERVIAAASHRRLPPGTTADDLYGALCYDYLPRARTGDALEKGLRSGEIHGVVHARWEALRIQREMGWSLEWARLLRIVDRLLERVEHERPGALDDYYARRLRRALMAAALGLNRQRLRVVLDEHPRRSQVLVLVDDAILPVILSEWGWRRSRTVGTG